MSDNYQVGYGKPPEEYQFSKGQSGNPSGRPKNQRNSWKEVFGEFSRQRKTITWNGNKIDLSMMEIYIMDRINKALKGDLRAFREIANFQAKPIKAGTDIIMQEVMDDGTIKRIISGSSGTKTQYIRPRYIKKTEDGQPDFSSVFPSFDENPQKFIDHILQEKITVQDKKGQREITKKEALVEMIFSKAMAGDVKACKIMQDMFPDNYFTEELIIEVVGMDLLEGL